MNKLFSPLRYSGGKSRLYKEIKKYFPKDKEIMIDLFFGGGSVGLNWLADNPNHKLIVNDIDSALINFWKCVKENPKFLLAYEMYINEKQWCKEALKKEIWGLPSLTFLIRNKCSYNGLHNNPVWSERAFKENFNKSTFDRIEKCHELLSKSRITNKKYQYWLYNAKFWQGVDGIKTFIYLDSPYFIKNAKKLYKYGNFNHYELANHLKNFKPKWVLSINDCQEIRELYSDFNIYEIDAIYSMSNNGGRKSKRVKELVITNFAKEDNLLWNFKKNLEI